MKTKIIFIIVLLSFLGCCKQNESLPVHGLLWQIKGNGLSKPSYLFGTAHTPEAIQIIDSIPVFKSVFTSTHQFICEMLPDSTIVTNPFSPEKTKKTLSFLKPWPVADSTYAILLTDTQRNILDSACQTNKNINLIEWGNIRPMSGINLIKSIKRAKSNILTKSKVTAKALPDNDSLIVYILDFYLLNQAKLHQLKTIGLETKVERQIHHDSIVSHIPQLSYRTEVDIFIHYLENNKQIDSLNGDYENKLMSQYFSQDLDKMLHTKAGLKTNIELINWWRGYDNSEIVKRYIIEKRNAQWIQRIPELIQETSSFIAVGAGHLGGEKGLINQLRELNYKVIPIEDTLIE